MRYLKKLLELIQSRKFQVMVAAIWAAWEVYSVMPKTPETTGALILGVAYAIGKWQSAQGNVDAVKAANGK
jgi:hypothetical protein